MSTITPTIIQLTPDQVIVEDRLRAVDADYVQVIAASMAETGQHTPVQVLPADQAGMHRLVSGAHRVAAAQIAGLKVITALVVDVDDLQAQLLEVDENLMRRELSELDRAVFLARRQEIYLQLHPETGHGKGSGRKNDKVEKNFHFARPATFALETAKKLGVTDRLIRLYLGRASIEPDLRERLANTRWADHGATLDALAKAGPADRRKMVMALTRAENPARNVAAAQVEVMGSRAPVRNERAKRLDALLSAWRHADKATQREFLDGIANERAGRELLMEVAARLQERAEADQATVVAAISGERSAA